MRNLNVLYTAWAGMPHFTVLCFITLCRDSIFSKLKVCGNTALSGDGWHF